MFSISIKDSWLGWNMLRRIWYLGSNHVNSYLLVTIQFPLSLMQLRIIHELLKPQSTGKYHFRSSEKQITAWKVSKYGAFSRKNSVFGHFSGSVSFFGEFVTPLAFSAQADHEGSYKGNFSLTLTLNIFECITIF